MAADKIGKQLLSFLVFLAEAAEAEEFMSISSCKSNGLTWPVWHGQDLANFSSAGSSEKKAKKGIIYSALAQKAKKALRFSKRLFNVPFI